MGIEHIALYVDELQPAADFFVNYFGGSAGPVYHNPRTEFTSRFISFESGARLELMKKGSVTACDRTQEHTGFAHLAFSVGSIQAVDRLTERLREDGYEILSGPRVTGDGYYESCVLGVEGNRIEITV